MANKQEDKKQTLSSEEYAKFRNLLKCYEQKEYKKGLKGAESILKNNPVHGETLALKGLFLNNLEKKEEGYECVKLGISKNIKSHISWHIYGLLYRADKNYVEAAKCYTMALKFNKDDLNILRDYALLQTQTRSYDALVETRTKLLEHRPKEPAFWLTLAVAYQLVNKPENGIKVLENFFESDVIATNTDFEKSELLMYHSMLLEETGNFEAALSHLLEIEPKVTDKRAWKEKHALFLAKLDKKEEAEKAYRLLVSENPHNVAYISEFLALKDKADYGKALNELFSQYPRSNVIESLILDHVEGDSFKVRVEATLQNGLRKGIPSLFAFMKKYYPSPEKQKTIDELVNGYLTSLEKNGTFGNDDDTKEPPTALLWTLYYLAQHYDYHKQLDKALALINKAISHTPTVVELYMTKGRILKHQGQIQEASTVLNEARTLDLQDRFVNSKCAKYMLRTGQIEEAIRTLGLFTRKEVETTQDLADMQCQWFMLEEGKAYLAQKMYGKALKRFHTLEKFYVDYFDDQFDFHGYCPRKFTLRAYVNALRWEDKIRGHPFYLKAVKVAVDAYLALADKATAGPELDEFDKTDMSEADKKKARNKARKAALKAQQDSEIKKAETKKEAEKNKHDKKPIDLDPEGEKYTQTEKPLDDALQLIKPLENLAPNNVEIHALSFEIYIRQQKYLLAVKALAKIAKIDKTTSCLKTDLDRLKADVDAHKDLDARIKTVVDAQLVEISKA